jgi:hypothetical protein
VPIGTVEVPARMSAVCLFKTTVRREECAWYLWYRPWPFTPGTYCSWRPIFSWKRARSCLMWLNMVAVSFGWFWVVLGGFWVVVTGLWSGMVLRNVSVGKRKEIRARPGFSVPKRQDNAHGRMPRGR